MRTVALSGPEIARVVYRYIGVSSGCLGDFSYSSHAEFYPVYCDLDINPFDFEGTTRERFMQILKSADPRGQAAILRGVLERFPIDEGPDTRIEDERDRIVQLISRLESGTPVAAIQPQRSSDVVDRAIQDTEALIRSTGAPSAVDRVHTTLHGHLKAVCDAAHITYDRDNKTTELLKRLRGAHPKLTDLGPRSGDIARVLNACATILDALNPLRNQASVAHPNSQLLPTPEALLVINVSRTLLQYLDAKLD